MCVFYHNKSLLCEGISFVRSNTICARDRTRLCTAKIYFWPLRYAYEYPILAWCPALPNTHNVQALSVSFTARCIFADLQKVLMAEVSNTYRSSPIASIFKRMRRRFFWIFIFQLKCIRGYRKISELLTNVLNLVIAIHLNWQFPE